MILGDAAPDHPERGEFKEEKLVFEVVETDPKGREWPTVGFEPSYSTLIPIPHYYGGVSRELMVGGAVLMLLASPLYADALKAQFIPIIVGALAVVGLAGYTNPRKKWTATADAIVSGAACALYAVWAVIGYDEINLLSFMLRTVIAIVFLMSFYFAMKTVRAFVLNQIGKSPDLRDLR